mgnify:CR=1 FL=1
MINVMRAPGESPGQPEPAEFTVTVAKNQTLLPGEVNRVQVTIPAAVKQWGFQSGTSDPEVVPVPGEYQDGQVFIRNLKPHPVMVRQGKKVGRGVEKDVQPEPPPPTPEQLQQLWEKLELGDNPTLKEHPAATTKLKQILYKRFNVFSREDSKFGRTPDHEMTLRLQPGTKPARQTRAMTRACDAHGCAFLPGLQATCKPSLALSWVHQTLHSYSLSQF